MGADRDTRRWVTGSRLAMWGGAGVAASLLLVLLGLGVGADAVWIAGLALLIICAASCARLWLIDRRAGRDLEQQVETLRRRREGQTG
jgi:hypothetical protein